MKAVGRARVVLFCGLLGGVAAVCPAQSYTPAPPPLTTLPPCPLGKNGKPLKKQKNCDPTIYPSEKVEPKGRNLPETATQQTSTPDAPGATTPTSQAAQQFPFPGEQAVRSADSPAAKAFPFPGPEDQGKPAHDSDVAHDPAAEKKAADTPAGKAFPFPGGSTADMPIDPDLPSPAKQPEGESSSSSSSSSDANSDSGSSSSTDASNAPGPKGEYDDDDSAPAKPKDKSRRKAPRPQTDTERVDEDLSVAKYYGQSGNKMGAYLRAKDAVKTQPDYAEAHFVLGQAARRLDKKDEAAAEFREYLKLAPDGERAKAAEKALEELR